MPRAAPDNGAGVEIVDVANEKPRGDSGSKTEQDKTNHAALPDSLGFARVLSRIEVSRIGHAGPVILKAG
jgi:hypothetical protein